MRAAKGHDLESMRVLLDAGADATLTQDDGSTALHVMSTIFGAVADEEAAAAERQSVELLLGAGLNVNAAGPAGDTPLHRAAQRGKASLIESLVEGGADLDAVNDAGLTALDIVMQPGRSQSEEIAALLARLAGRE